MLISDMAHRRIKGRPHDNRPRPHGPYVCRFTDEHKSYKCRFTDEYMLEFFLYIMLVLAASRAGEPPKQAQLHNINKESNNHTMNI
jgi:hypothetical protein